MSVRILWFGIVSGCHQIKMEDALGIDMVLEWVGYNQVPGPMEEGDCPFGSCEGQSSKT